MATDADTARLARLRRVYRWRRPVDGTRALTYAAIGARLGVSRPRARQLYSLALEVFEGTPRPRWHP